MAPGADVVFGLAPEWRQPVLRHVTSDRFSQEQLVADLDRALTLPGEDPICSRLARPSVTAPYHRLIGPDVAAVTGSPQEPNVHQRVQYRVACHRVEVPEALGLHAREMQSRHLEEFRANHAEPIAH